MPSLHNGIALLAFGALAIVGAVVLVITGNTVGNYAGQLLGLAGIALGAAAGITLPRQPPD